MLVLALAGPLLTAGPAAAGRTTAPVWAIQQSPDANVPGGQINSVSCPAATVCEAVGSYVNGTGTTVPLAESWNGTAWHLQHTAVPAGATVTTFTGVSCAAADFCEAVGNAIKGSSPPVKHVPLAETWNGTSWQQQRFPVGTMSVSRSFGGLAGVSCPSTGFCEAVGTLDTTGFPKFLADFWDGTAWQLQRRTPSSLSNLAGLTGVSCVSSTYCEAVSSQPPQAIRWNGRGWKAQPVPGSINDTLNAVSCVTAQFCEAVGSVGEQWNGTTWTAQPISASGLSLADVSCASASFCEAVGSASEIGRVTQAAEAEQWNGTTWVAQPVPMPALARSAGLGGVSCAAAGACAAGGFFSEQPSGAPQALAEAWNGSSWGIQHAVAPGSITSNSLAGVSCVATDFCEAAGSYNDSQGGPLNLAEAWDGASWRLQFPPNPTLANNVHTTMTAVSCVSVDFCEAVGQGIGGGGGSSAWLWNGAAWETQAVPSNALGLTSVSCVSADFCEAVGPSGADVWNGTSWSAQSTPAFSSFTSVSCVSADFCETAGASIGGASAYEWNGTTWSPQTVPTPSGGTSVALDAVSCAAANSCDIVGLYGAGNTTNPLAEAWNGTAWAVQLAPTSFSYAYLTGVSCASAVSCTAVGTSLVGGATSGLAEVWDGTAWSSPSTPNGPTTNNNLSGVSCPAPGTCIAVGHSQPGQYVGEPGPFQRTLIETGD
jgi:hypothetical protein